MFFQIYTEHSHYGNGHFRKIAKVIYRANTYPGIQPSYHYFDFPIKNDNLGKKMKILKFLGIQPIYDCCKSTSSIPDVL